LSADQVSLATTAIPRGVSTTSTTPLTCRVAEASNDVALAPNKGGRASTAVSMSGSRTSIGKRCWPVLLAAESTRRSRSLPM
jgi:hypothetical protein